MKFRYLPIVFLLVIIGVSIPVLAQTTKTLPTECADGIDNDKDGGIDYNGRTVEGKLVEVDKDCKTAQTQCEDGTYNCPGATKPAPASGASDFNLQVRINNPLKVDTIEGAIQLFMNAVLRIAIPFIIIFFIWSGLSFVLARGNAEKIKTAKKMFWYTIIGTLLILGAWTITNAIIGTVNSITG